MRGHMNTRCRSSLSLRAPNAIFSAPTSVKSALSRVKSFGGQRHGETSSATFHRSRPSPMSILRAVDEAREAGPQGAFEEDTLADARRDLFDRIAPVYDE
ncbi:hypothetical protein CYMTET_40868, partial [Cymbomonas tetramitiformis]